MKKTFKTLVFAMVGLLALASCEDVPAPYTLPDKNGGSSTPETTIEPQGDGTAASPFNVAAAVAMIKGMEAGVESTEEYYIKGKVLAVTTTEATIAQYGNHTFTMVDEGDNSTVFTAFQVYGPGKQKFTSVNDIKVGDEVVVCGKVVNYKGNTPETVGKGAAYVVSINSAGGGDSQGGGSEGTAITCAEAVQLTNALADGGISTETYTITGYITEVVGSVSRNQQTFWMADTKDGGKVFEAYWANLPEGVTEFKVGMKVKITGQLMKYVNNSGVTPEIKNANVVILENGDGGGQGGDDGGQGGDTVTDLENGGFEEWVSDSQPTGWKSASTASNAELGKSTEAHGGSFACIVKAPGTANKRLATQEITLAAGSYTFSFYAKSTTADASQTRCGYVPVNADNGVGSYKYGDYANLSNTEWTLVSYDFDLTEETKLCLVVMNPKNSSYSVSQDILVDDATLVKK